ncbi:tetratricopeptide repeat protein [Anabaena sp. CS-542/02]|nr:tetratricopeptide repeat protein [Anabaena sp. CS-542/02]
MESLISKAEDLLKKGESEQSVTIIQKALEIEPDNIEALKMYAESLVEINQLEEALIIYKKTLQLAPNNVSILRNYSSALLRIADYDKALFFLDKALQEEPNNVKVLSTYIKALLKLKLLHKAFIFFEKSLQIKPNNIITLNSYGKALADAGNYEKSSEIFERALQIKPNHIITLTSYGKALAEAGNYEKACEIFERALQIKPNNIITLNSYGKALADAGNYEKACEIFERALQIKPNDIITLTSYGKALADAGNYEKACEIFERALQIQPNNITALTSYGKALADAGNYEKSSEIFERLLQINPNNYISFIYAICLEELSRYTDAISQLESIDFDSLPQYHVNVIHISLGRLYYCLKLYEQGDKYFNLAIANSDDKEKSLLSSARSIFAHNPHNETAVKMLQQIGEESPRYSQALEMLTLNLSEEDYFEMVKSDYQSGLNDTEILNRAIYHKIANEISILKGIAYRILRCSQAEDPLLTGIITDIEDVLEEVNRRRALEKSQIETISDDGYEKILEIISKTAHDISDFVNNQLAIIESKTRRAMRKIAVDAPHYTQFGKLLIQLELTQVALSDLKAINEGIKIKNHHFKVKKLFETWEANPQIGHASIFLDIQNGDSNFNGDEEKIKSILNELVENSLKHNAKKLDLQICMTAQDVINPSGIRGVNVPGEQKYLLIEFKDDGKGIPPDKKDWIFQPLKTTASESHGSGLGLFIIRKTLTQMNGYIQETGRKGAKFKIYIPYT